MFALQAAYFFALKNYHNRLCTQTLFLHQFLLFHYKPHLKNTGHVLGEAAVGASRTNTFLGERYRRIARRRGKKKAVVAVGRSILVIVWYLLSDPEVGYHDLGPGFYDSRINPDRKKRNHIRELEALGYKVTLEPAA